MYLLISYNSEILRDICFDSQTAINYLGEEAAINLQARHSDLQAAGNIYELPVGKIFVDGNLCTLKISGLLTIVMTPNYPSDGGLFDWSTVRRVRLTGINHVA